MERAPLRPVPSRPEGPVDEQEAIGFVKGALPVLDDPAARALALVELAGRPRTHVEEALDLQGEPLGEALARGRKELRRSMYPLAGSGWCERAERMISDRMDGVLEPPGPARLGAHLEGCERCLEHERRLAQAIDRLAAGFAETAEPPAPEAPPVAAAPEPELEPEPPSAATAPSPEPPPRGPAEDSPAEPEPAPAPPAVELRLVEPGQPAGPAPTEIAPQALPEQAPTEVAPQPQPAEPLQPVAQPQPEPPAAAQPAHPPRSPEPAAPSRTASSLASTAAWNLMLLLAVLLAIATVGVAVAGALGASL